MHPSMRMRLQHGLEGRPQPLHRVADLSAARPAHVLEVLPRSGHGAMHRMLRLVALEDVIESLDWR